LAQVQRALHIFMIATTLMAYAQAPFAHVHDTGSDHARAHANDHSHFTLHEDHDHPVWEAAEDSDEARWMEWLAGDGTAVDPLWIHLPASPHAHSLEQSAHTIVAPQPCNHDPPQIAQLPSRAPPSLPHL
jgi:hypothetical protein